LKELAEDAEIKKPAEQLHSNRPFTISELDVVISTMAIGSAYFVIVVTLHYNVAIFVL
jgi:hypothetical protein